MREIRFRAWVLSLKKMYYRGYQQWDGVVVCDQDASNPNGKGIPVLKISHSDCILLECTDLIDQSGDLIFESDIVQIHTSATIITGVVPAVPDMFRSRGLHPLHEIFGRINIAANDVQFMKVIGNAYETPARMPAGN